LIVPDDTSELISEASLEEHRRYVDAHRLVIIDRALVIQELINAPAGYITPEEINPRARFFYQFFFQRTSKGVVVGDSDFLRVQMLCGTIRQIDLKFDLSLAGPLDIAAKRIYNTANGGMNNIVVGLI